MSDQNETLLYRLKVRINHQLYNLNQNEVIIVNVLNFLLSS